MDNRKRAALYREAARIVEEHNGLTCCVVAYLANGKDPYGPPAARVPEAQRYAKIFASSMTGPHGYGKKVGELPDDDVHDFRVTALCFAAAMVEAGDA